MTTNTLPAPGAIARFALDNGDRYIGEIVEAGGNCVVVRNYAAWYEGVDQPYNSKYADDEARFVVNARTRITQL